jgi:hypothetical protein
MIIHDCEQGSLEWEQLRIGIPTASKFDRIVTPARLELSKSADEYRNQILAEWLLGYSIQFGNDSGYIDRGIDVENEARAFYELAHDVEARRVGFVTLDDGTAGGSPDSLIGEEGGIEIKVPAVHTHIGYFIKPASFEAKYKMQCQGYMYLTDRNWWDLISYHRGLPVVERRIARDPVYMKALHTALTMFCAELDDLKERLKEFKSERRGLASV